ncbi:MAG: TetR/AcrR family transcriptional regulator [Hyphomonas sp.]
MPAVAKHYEAILTSAVKLFRQQGYAGTGLSEILKESGAPKGSLYHYFPGGKVEIGEAAIKRAGETVSDTFRHLAGQAESTAEMLSCYFDLMAGWMAESGFRDGSPITTIILETVPEEGRIQSAGRDVIAEWTGILTAKGVSDGLSAERAERLARLSLFVLDGALVQCRLTEDAGPLREAADELARFYMHG